MLEQTYVTVLLFTTFLLVCCTNVGCKIVEIDLSDDLPKNIMVGTFVNDKNHLKPMLDICAILIERGYNVSFFKQIRFFLFGMPKNRFFFIDPWDLGMFEFDGLRGSDGISRRSRRKNRSFFRLEILISQISQKTYNSHN